jgi:hypothetical protein
MRELAEIAFLDDHIVAEALALPYTRRASSRELLGCALPGTGGDIGPSCPDSKPIRIESL